ncbi:hypothetical protein GOODEAATRI_021776, partial [Goodea atripinnis]
KDSMRGSTSSAPRPEPETVPSAQTSVSTPLHQTGSPSLEEAQPPASEKSSSSQGLSVPEAARSGTHSAATLADDVFSAADEVQPAPNSPHKEFHSAVVRALIKDPLNVEAAEGGQASGTSDEVESSQKALAFHSLP